MTAKIDVSFLSGRLAKDKEGRNYYFAGDSEHVFLFATKNELNDELKKIMDYSYSVSDIKPVSYKVMGITKEIPEELRKIVLEAYNKLFENEKIEDVQLENYIGEYYLDETNIIDSTENIKLILLIISVVLMIISVVLVILTI